MCVTKESRGFALDHLFSFCYLCYWDLILEECCRFSRVSALFANKYPYTPLVIPYFTVIDFVGGRLYLIFTFLSQYLGLH